jgi:hypothetical protein
MVLAGPAIAVVARLAKGCEDEERDYTADEGYVGGHPKPASVGRRREQKVH